MFMGNLKQTIGPPATVFVGFLWYHPQMTNVRGKEEEQIGEECGMEGRPATLLPLLSEASLLSGPFTSITLKRDRNFNCFVVQG